LHSLLGDFAPDRGLSEREFRRQYLADWGCLAGEGHRRRGRRYLAYVAAPTVSMARSIAETDLGLRRGEWDYLTLPSHLHGLRLGHPGDPPVYFVNSPDLWPGHTYYLMYESIYVCGARAIDTRTWEDLWELCVCGERVGMQFPPADASHVLCVPGVYDVTTGKAA